MKIRQLQIHNYRSIADQTINFGDYSLLIGPNNSGKSNVLDALRTVYEKDLKFDFERDFPKFPTADQESWVEIEFELSPQEAQTIKAEYLMNGNRFRVRKWLHPAEQVKRGLIGYENRALSENKFYGFPGVGQGKLGNVIYIPAVSRLEEHTKLTGPSALRDLINDILKPIVKSSPAFNTLSTDFAKFSQAIKTEATPDNRSLADLERRINNEIKDWGVAFNLDVSPPQVEDIIKNLIRHTLTDSALNTEMSPEAFGHGLQRHLIFTLIRIAAGYTASKPPPTKKEFSPEMELLLFEEPEAFLHPPQQDLLDRSLRQLAAQPGRQVIAATHSPLFVSSNTDDLADLVRFRRVAGKTEIAQITKERLKEIFGENQKLAQILGHDASEPELEAVRYFLWLNPERSSLFFANAVLIVEGLSEQVLINYLLKKGEIAANSSGVFVLETHGKYNIHRFMRLLGELKIDHAVLHDSDTNKAGEEKKKQDALNKLIQDSKNAHTKAVATLPGNLEDFLGIQAGIDRWKKAAQVLLAVQQGKVAVDKLETFKNKVSVLLKALAC
ncbi:MAG: AAA family ATPase [Thermoanaerobaculum sp.]|nr:AAA family ATPase [Thermoanaerobaculum sp.]